MKKRLFFDMDNVLVDFKSGLDKVDESTKAQYRAKTPDEKDRLDEIPGIFSLMEPMKGAVEAVRELAKVYDVFILSTAPWNNPSAWSDKVEWVKKYFGEVFYKRMVITHRKDLCEGDYLIDDRGKNGTSEFKGEWIKFGSSYFPDWKTVTEYLLIRKNREKSKTTVKQLLDNRNTYSWAALFILLLCETFAFCGIHCSWCIWGPWTLLASLLVIAIGIVGNILKHTFNLRSVILTKLLANTISPQPLGTIYLLLFVIHIGWLTNAVMNLFMPDDIVDVAISVGICIFGLIILICFFPDGKVEKNKGNKFKVFVSGISGLNSVPPSLDFDKYNVRPLVRILEETNMTGDDCEFLILLSDFYTKAKKQEPDEEKKELQRRWDVIRDTVKLAVPDLNEDEFSKLTIEEKLERLIIETAKNEFREREISFKKLKIHFTAPCNYEDFPTCFRLLSNEIREYDTRDKEICFNLTPGPASISSIVTLLSIDADRKLYYYSQDDSKRNKPIELVDKTKVPLENLLSQAIDTLKQ